MAHEVELKLRIRASEVPRLRRHPEIMRLCIGQPLTRKLTSIYYDTPQLALLKAGISLRVRRMAGGWFQAVKAAGHALAGLHQRMEWEDIIAAGHPDFSKILDPSLTRIFDDRALRAALQPIFTTEVRRTEWQLVLEDGSEVEMALDLGKLIAGDSQEPISEVELELKRGQAAGLFELALALQGDIPLWIENVSKAQRGYAHYLPQPPSVVKAGKVHLQADMPPGKAFRTIAWQCLGQLQGNQDVVLQGVDNEGVHQMRVALRRLRSAMGVFRPVLGKKNSAQILQEIAWVTELLGQARDLDVFLGETMPDVLAALPEHAGLVQLQQKAQLARKKSYAQLCTALESQRYQRLLLTLGAWLENTQRRSHSPTAGQLPEMAAAMLEKRHRQLVRHGNRLHKMAAEERHAARIAAKKLRYAAEFFASLYPKHKTTPYIRQLSQLQEVLGILNDIAVTEQLVRQLLGKRPPQALKEALPVFLGWNASHAECRLPDMKDTWHAFARAKPFWKRGPARK